MSIPPVPKNMASHVKEDTVDNGSKRVHSVAEHEQLHLQREEKGHDLLDEVTIRHVAEQDHDPSKYLSNSLDKR